MQTTVEETAKHTVKLSVEVPPEEFAQDLDRAYRKVAGEIRIPGFRKGHVPKQVIDARVGRDAVFHEFVEEFLPRYYVKALREHDLAPIADPEFDIGDHDIQAGRPFRFTATVEVRPRLSLSPEDYAGIRVDAPETEPSERELDEYIDHLRDRFAELEPVSRAARPGDYVLADVRATVHGEEVPEATQIGYLEEIGSNALVPELDTEFEGKRNTLAELREDLRTKLGTIKEAEARGAVRDAVLRKLLDRVEVDLPERLVDEETEERVASAVRRIERQGGTLEDALAAQGWDELRFRSDARAHATRAIKADLVLEAVARNEELEVTKEELEREIAGLAQASDRDPKEVRRILDRSGQVTAVAGDIIRTKALDLLVERADVSSGGERRMPDSQPSHESGDADE